MIRLSNVIINIDEDIRRAVSNQLKIDAERILGIEIVRKSIDARLGDIKFVYTFDVKTSADENKIIANISNASHLPQIKKMEINKGKQPLGNRPVIIGAGPAGLFAALLLSQYGYKPLIIERGKKVDERDDDVNVFLGSSKLDLDSNISFGEGGAGTYSDGKLKTRISDERCFFVLDELHKAGAPKSILYDASPHVGTDILKEAIKNIRTKIEELGGQYIFDCKIDDLEIQNNKIYKIKSEKLALEAQAVILATGHSAKDTYRMLYDRGVKMEQKPFAMGVRIEHPKEIIDKAMYHKYAGNKKLGAASYSANVRIEDKNVYTFCMCPGGVVVNSSNEQGALSINGMSEFNRNGKNSNSAIVCQIPTELYGNTHVLAGIEYQRRYEEKAYILGGGDYCVPAERLADFLSGGKPRGFEVLPTVLPKAVPCDIKSCLPYDIYEPIRRAIPLMGKRIYGFDMGGAVISAIESRTSSPVRILRGADFMSVNIEGLYPAGEGAGYSGGIVSSAVDGLRVASAIIEKYSSEGL